MSFITLRSVAFLIAGTVALALDLWQQLDLLFSIEVAIVRGMVALWILEFAARMGRVIADSWGQDSRSEVVDRLTSTLTSGALLYLLFSLWIGSVAILDGMFSTQPYRMFASFLKVGSAFTCALWLGLNILTFAGGSRQTAHKFLATLKELGKRATEGDLESATEPVKDYPHGPTTKANDTTK